MLKTVAYRLRGSALVERALKYGLVGAFVNAVLYGGYLGLTLLLGMRPALATTLIYILGIALTYLGNALWAFDRSRSHYSSAWRYVVTYFAGYLVQISTLMVLIRVLAVPHPLAQLVSMGAAAGSIFVLLNIWVFRQTPTIEQES